MLNCCNCDFRSCYCHVVANKENFYRRIEFGICPKCGVYKFLDFRLIKGEKKRKKLTGKAAERAYEKSLERIEERNSYSKSKQNFYY